MAKKLVYTDLAVNAQADATADLMENGVLLLCDGPMDIKASRISKRSACVIVAFDLDVKAFGKAVGGLIDTTIVKDAYAVRKGKPSWACMTTDKYEPVLFMTAGTGNVNIILDMPQGGYEEGDKVFISGISLLFPHAREEMK